MIPPDPASIRVIDRLRSPRRPVAEACGELCRRTHAPRVVFAWAVEVPLAMLEEFVANIAIPISICLRTAGIQQAGLGKRRHA